MKPASMKKFDMFYLGSIAVGLIGFALAYNDIVAQTNAELTASGVEPMGTGVIIGSLIFGVLINLALWFLVSVQRIGLVKWLIALLIAWGVISLLTSLGAGFTTEVLIGLASTALGIVSLYFLFQPESTEWLARDRGRTDLD